VRKSSNDARGALVAGAFAAVLAGCGHTRSVGPAETPSKAEGSEPAKEPAKETSVPKRQRATPNAEIEIASTPAALLKPGGAGAIQERLVQSGDLTGEPSGELDGPTHAALERFQRAHDLPATGVPDNATVKKLGLDGGKVFRSGD
jgi:Putative peptidoglycan binding domain